MSLKKIKPDFSTVLPLGIGPIYAGSGGGTVVGAELSPLECNSDRKITCIWCNLAVVAHADDTPAGVTRRFDDPGFRLAMVRNIFSKCSIHGGYSTAGELSNQRANSI